MTEANPQAGATDVNGAAARLKTMLLSEQKPTDTPSETAEAPVETQESTAETPQSDTEQSDRRFKAKLGDRDVEFELLSDDFDLDEVPKALMMEADYRKKTSEVSRSRKEVEEKNSKIDQHLAELAQALEFQVNNLDSDEMNQLKDEDPETYWSHVDKVKTKAEQYRSWQEKRNEELQAKQSDLIGSEMQKYTEVVPEWLDENVKQSDFKKMGKALVDIGFKEQEIANFYDHRLIALVRKAALYDEIKSQKPNDKLVKSKPKSASPGARPHESEGARSDRQKSRDRLAKTGRMTDAQAAIKQILQVK